MADISSIDDSKLASTRHALERVQSFNPDSIIREKELGNRFAFTSAVEPARKVISLFQTLQASHLDFFPEQQLDQIKTEADAFFNLLETFLHFEIDGAQPNPKDAQENMLSNLNGYFQRVFNSIHPLVAYAAVRSQDFSALETEARAATQSAKDIATSLVTELGEQKRVVDGIITEVRSAAAEQGVSKQAIHFKNEADAHNTQSKTWLKYSTRTAIGLGLFAILSLFIHKIPFFSPENAYETTQLAVSKILIFAVISYMLLLCARNFMSHKHNEVVNRHRQNALATFTALAEAASEQSSADIVLTHAASCIFSPQETGYAKQDGGHSEAPSSLQLLTKIQQPSAAVG
ncbi:hypothetical protein [Sphingorhabdus sp.]|uniref:hypothetical protein n=1 Tax=Sphingorhabdus sp. TaxID=1902408 RepID=UPI0032B7AF4C